MNTREFLPLISSKRLHFLRYYIAGRVSVFLIIIGKVFFSINFLKCCRFGGFVPGFGHDKSMCAAGSFAELFTTLVHEEPLVRSGTKRVGSVKLVGVTRAG